MKKDYIAPDAEIIKILLSHDVLGASIPEITQSETGVIENPTNEDF